MNIKQIRELLARITPGPWRTANGNGAASVVSEHPEHGCQIYLNVRTCEIKDTVDRWKRDAEFIAASPTIARTLLARVERLEALAREACDQWEAWATAESSGPRHVHERLSAIRAELGKEE